MFYCPLTPSTHFSPQFELTLKKQHNLDIYIEIDAHQFEEKDLLF